MKHEQFAGGVDPAAAGPLSTIPGMTYVTPLPPSRSVSKLPLALGLVALVFAIVAGTVLVMRLTAQTGPTNAETLLSVVDNNLQTPSYRQDMTYGSITYTLLVDAAVATNPRINAYRVTSTAGQASQVSTYADNRNAYLKYVAADSGLVPAKAIGQWIAFRQNSVIPATAPVQLSQLTEPAFQLLGPFVTGQFSSDQRQALLKQWSVRPVLSFSDKAVKSATVEGKDVLVYEVQYNSANLEAYARMVAGYMGMPDVALQRALAGLAQYRSNTLYVDPVAKRVIKAEYSSLAGNVSTVFSGFGTTPVANEPKAAFQYGDLTPIPHL
jgi:hypothetical protein